MLDARAADLHGQEWPLEVSPQTSEWTEAFPFGGRLQAAIPTALVDGPWNVGMDEGIPVPGPELGGQFE